MSSHFARFTLLAFLAVTPSGCGDSDKTVPAGELTGLDAREALSLANKWRSERPGVNSTLTARAVEFVFENGGKAAVPLPDDTMVIAVAPYLTYTHPCSTHSMTTCAGELADITVRVLARTGDSALLIDQTMTTMDNGFVEIWLPRNREINLTVEANGKKAAGLVTTYDSSKTCLTEFKLE